MFPTSRSEPTQSPNCPYVLRMQKVRRAISAGYTRRSRCPNRTRSNEKSSTLISCPHELTRLHDVFPIPYGQRITTQQTDKFETFAFIGRFKEVNIATHRVVRFYLTVDRIAITRYVEIKLFFNGIQ